MKRLFLGVAIGLCIVISSVEVYAAQSHSTNYEVNEVQFGAGGLLNASSASYQAQQSAGSTGAGLVNSTHYGASAGFLTANEPFLAMTVSASTINLGSLSPTASATGSATFSVRTYVDSGYVVISENPPPVQESGYYLATIPTAAASSVGTEQFGINLVQNLTTCPHPAPANFGASPVQFPNGNFANGQAASGYNTCGLFQYNQGDIVAQSSGNGWGQTNYTISYLANVSPTTKAGSYTMTQDLVAVTTF